MPIYEYQCRKCGEHIEQMQKITDKPLTKCRKCGGRLDKQWSSTSFQFKGSGWYVTDYAGKKSEPKEEKSSGVDDKMVTPKSTQAEGEKSSRTESEKSTPAEREKSTRAESDKPASKTSKNESKKPASSNTNE
jgi:putative FmdB family regulatory protein